MLILLHFLSAAFDTIDHDNIFCILGKYVGLCGNALKLIKSQFSNRTQRVQIDNVLSDFANIICGVPQGSVLGHLKFCLYLLPMSAIFDLRTLGKTLGLMTTTSQNNQRYPSGYPCEYLQTMSFIIIIIYKCTLERTFRP